MEHSKQQVAQHLNEHLVNSPERRRAASADVGSILGDDEQALSEVGY
jgi:hypothetical protein